jgi:2-aminoadipate transaminase
VTLPRGVTAKALLPVAERHGVSFVPAERAMLDGRDGALRLAFSFYRPAELAEGARRLGVALRAWAADT